MCFLFVHIELLRNSFAADSPLQMINDFMYKFIDGKDNKTLILSHLYLLIGCIWPLIYSRQNQIDHYLVLYNGLVSLCVSDSMVRSSGGYSGQTIRAV